MTNIKVLFHWLYGHILSYNLFVSQTDVNDNDTDEPQEAIIVIKQQRYATWLYILLLIVSTYVVFFIAFMTPQPTTITNSNITPAIFNTLHLEHAKTLSCPCSTSSMPYKTFVFNNIKFHPICSSFFISQQWIEALYIVNASEYDALDFRKTANSQFKLLARFCSLSKDAISQNQLNLDNNEFISLYLLPEEQVRSEVMATDKLFKNNAINRIISFINYSRIITQTNHFVSALNTNFLIRIYNNWGTYTYEGGWMRFQNDQSSQGKSETTCGNSNPTQPAGFFDPSYGWYAGLTAEARELKCLAMVNGSFGGCTPLEALLSNTLDCLYDVKCLELLLKYFPTLNQMHLNWSDYVLPGKKQNISLDNHLLHLFVEEWSAKLNYSMYFDQCAPSLCTYTTMKKTNFVHAITLLISLYGGLVLIFRLIAPFIVSITLKFKHRSRNINNDSGYFKTHVHKVIETMKRLNLFKKENEQSEDSIKQQRIITRVYLFLLAGGFLILVLFTSLKTQTTTITVSNPSLDNYSTLQVLHSNTLKCPCSMMTIPYHEFISLNPTLHQVCSSDFVSERWISIMISITYQKIPSDWLNQAGLQFKLLSDLCHLANKTIDDAIHRFIIQSFISSNVLTEFDFNIQLNETLHQFFQSTIIYFAQLIDIVDLVIRVDQPLIQLGSSQHTPPSNVFIADVTDEMDGRPSIELKLLLPATRDINSSSVNCICATNSYCQSLVAIYSDEDVFTSSNNLPIVAYIVPGLIAGCFVSDSLMFSTLECFYLHSNCISVISSYIKEAYHKSTDDPQSIDIRPLIYNALLSRFAPNASIGSIVKEIMIERWNQSISYNRYYELCAPSYCAYSDTIRVKTTVGIFVSLLSMIGGLCASLSLITPHLIRLIYRLLKLMRRRQTQQQEEQQVHSKWFDRLKTMMQKLINSSYIKLIELNMFPMWNSGSIVDRMTAKRLGQWTTRLYIVLLIIGMTILALYTVIQPQILTKTFDTPSFNQYNRLKQAFGDRLQCSCSLIASKYERFVKIEPVFHQICSSSFVSNEWQFSLISGLVSNLSDYSIRDYRRFLSAHLQFLTGLCQISIQSVNNSIDQFLSSLFVTSQLLSEISFRARLNSQIKQSQSNVSITFAQLLTLIGNINDGNAIISTYETNFRYTNTWHILGDSYADTEAIIYDNHCSCRLHQNCTIQASFIKKNSSITVPIKGLKMGCTPSESFRASTLECFYNLSCINLIQQYTNYTNTNKSKYTPNPLFTNMSRFPIDTTIAQLTNDLFTETWKTTINYSSYFEHCATLVCSYIYVQKLNSFYTVTVLLGLEGGLSIVLKWICPKIIRIIFKIYQYRKRRTNVIQPILTTRTIPIEVVDTTVRNPVIALESIPASETSQTNVFLSVRRSLKIFIICILLLFVIITLIIFSIYFISQAKNQVVSTVSFLNTTTNMNLNTTTLTTSATTSIITTTRSTCQLKFQSIAIVVNTSYDTSSPIVADFNHDGRSDLAVIFRRFASGYVMVLLGNDTGMFSARITLPRNDNYYCLAAGDFNNDKHVDLVFSNTRRKLVGVWLGNGDGTFETPIIHQTRSDSSPHQIIVANFNNDSYLDMAVINSLDATVSIFLGNGNGTFAAETSILTGLKDSDQTISINTGDFNNDGYQDIVLTRSPLNYVILFLGYNNGTFKAQKRMFTGPSFIPDLISVNDFNGDTQLDIIFAYALRNAFSIMFGYGNGTFSTKKNFFITANRTIQQMLFIVNDLNEDGLSDVIIGDLLDLPKIDVLLGDGNGDFELQTIYLFDSQNQGVFYVVIGDFNGDGHQDIVVVNSKGGIFNILLNTCTCCASNTLAIENVIHQ